MNRASARTAFPRLCPPPGQSLSHLRGGVTPPGSPGLISLLEAGADTQTLQFQLKRVQSFLRSLASSQQQQRGESADSVFHPDGGKKNPLLFCTINPEKSGNYEWMRLWSSSGLEELRQNESSPISGEQPGCVGQAVKDVGQSPEIQKRTRKRTF